MKVFIGPYKKKGSGRERVSVTIHRYDTWSLDYTLALVILPALKRFKEHQIGLWCHLFPEEWSKSKPTKRQRKALERRTQKAQNALLDKMIAAFEMVVADDITTEDPKAIETGLRIFAEHYRALWN